MTRYKNYDNGDERKMPLESEAVKKFCPLCPDIEYCIGNDCMAWIPGSQDKQYGLCGLIKY